jgi:hypothetical protein
MSGFTSSNTDHLTRSNLWSNMLKDVFETELMGVKYVHMITDFPDGDTINIPSVGQMEASDYVENTPIRYSSMDTGNFTFTIDQYKQSGTYVTDKFLQDSMYMSRVQSMFVPKMLRALAVQIETKVMAVGPDGQTASGLNTINNAYHRYVGSGTNETMTIKDIHRARYALQKANVPMTNLVGIVDPSVTYQLGQQANSVNLLTPDPQWQAIVKQGASSGMRFMFNIAGFDIYESNWLKQNTSSETINSVTAAAGVHNLFFSAAPDALPFVGLIRQQPRVEAKRNIDMQREEYVVTCRYGFKLYRPENLVDILTDTDQVYA